MKEIWKPVVGYEGYYEVSNLGNVRSVDRYVKGGRGGNQRKRGCAMKLQTRKPPNNYLFVGLHKHNKINVVSVHRLVATAFIDNPNSLPDVNHKDEDKCNNAVSNLEWCTRKYNNNYATHNERVRQGNINNPKKSVPVIATLPDGREEWYPSISEATFCLTGRRNSGHICHVLSGKRNIAYGRTWRKAK